MPGFDPIRSLRSLEKVGASPLYTLTFYGGYGRRLITAAGEQALWRLLGLGEIPTQAGGGTLFTAQTPTGHRLLARNYPGCGPALLLYMAPPGGHASLSLVPLGDLGFGREDELTRLPLARRLRLLLAPRRPADGLNEYGLAIASEQRPAAGVPGPGKPRAVLPAMARRYLLDQATNPEEAFQMLGELPIALEKEPVAFFAGDEGGASGVVSYAGGQAQVQPNDRPWQVAGECAAEVAAQLAAVDGVTKVEAAMRILQSVAEPETAWSVVYVLTTGDVFVAMRRQYAVIHRFHLTLRA